MSTVLLNRESTIGRFWNTTASPPGLSHRAPGTQLPQDPPKIQTFSQIRSENLQGRSGANFLTRKQKVQYKTNKKKQKKKKFGFFFFFFDLRFLNFFFGLRLLNFAIFLYKK